MAVTPLPNSTCVCAAQIIGKSINEAGLRGVTGLYLFEIERADGTRLKAVTPDTLLEAGDLLWFAGEYKLLQDVPSCCHLCNSHKIGCGT